MSEIEKLLDEGEKLFREEPYVNYKSDGFLYEAFACNNLDKYQRIIRVALEALKWYSSSDRFYMQRTEGSIQRALTTLEKMEQIAGESK